MKHRHLVSLRRSRIDDHGMQGYVLDVSKELVALQYVYDFNLDGLRLVRRKDITEVRRTQSEEFQQGLLIEEGLESLVPFGVKFDLENWQSVIEQLSPVCPVLIFEDERRSHRQFEIGRVEKITASRVKVRGFSVDASWAKKPTTIPYGALTLIQANNNYINTYQRHFERTAAG
jgi:hypothetical protein